MIIQIDLAISVACSYQAVVEMDDSDDEEVRKAKCVWASD
jgi:hypothetical protein